MDKFYTNIGTYGRGFYHRYYNPITKLHETRFDEDVTLDYGVKCASDQETKSIFSDSLIVKRSNSIYDFRDSLKNNKQIDRSSVFGMEDATTQFTIKKYQNKLNVDHNLINIAYLDIETEIGDGFPKPEEVKQAINAITVCDQKGNISTFTTCKVDATKFTNQELYMYDSEEQLLSDFLDYWQKKQFHIITGWYLKFFDIPYMVRRIEKVLSKEHTAMLSPLYSKLKQLKLRTSSIEPREATQKVNGVDNMVYRIAGISVLDYQEVYSEFTYHPMESYSLEFVSQYELGYGKTDYSPYKNLKELYENDPTLFIEYNVKDVTNILNLEHKMKLLRSCILRSYDGKIQFDQIMMQTSYWESLIYEDCYNRGIYLPIKTRRDADTYEGAYVMEPKPKKYGWIISTDLTSLYPKIIIQYNMSPETYRGKLDIGVELKEALISQDFSKIPNWDEIHSMLIEKNYTLAPNGAMFTKDFVGIIPRLVAERFSQRVAYQKKLKKAKKDLKLLEKGTTEYKELSEEVELLNLLQLNKKIDINSIYGCLGAVFFRLYMKDIAEATTLGGQVAIRYIAKQTNAFLTKLVGVNDDGYVVYIDTDSNYIDADALVTKMLKGKTNVDEQKITNALDLFCSKELEPFMSKAYDHHAKYTNTKNEMIMKREVIASSAVWRGKKNYIIRVLDNEGYRYEVPVLKMMGVEAIKAKTPKFVKKALADCYMTILHKTEKEIQEYVKNFRTKFINLPFKEYASAYGVSSLDKWISSCDEDGIIVCGKGTPFNTKALVNHNNMLIKVGDKDTPPLQLGGKVNILRLKPMNPTYSNYIAFLGDKLPESFKLDEYIDTELQYEKLFLDPITTFTSIVGWDSKRKHKLF